MHASTAASTRARSTGTLTPGMVIVMRMAGTI